MISQNTTEKILIISLRYLGDVLLTTPLSRALKLKNKDAEIDFLVFKGTEGILEGNPDIRQVITIEERPNKAQHQDLIKKIKAHYDIVLVTQTSDKAHIYGRYAARTRFGFISKKFSHNWWKRLLIKSPLILDEQAHRVTEIQRLCQHLGLDAHQAPVPPQADIATLSDTHKRLFEQLRGSPFAIIHPNPRWRYKSWNINDWQALLETITAHHIHLVISGGPGKQEADYIQEILRGLSVDTQKNLTNVQGLLKLNELAYLLNFAHFYVGPDTGTTHLAASCGTPTIALFGPTNPVIWGPYPANGVFTNYQKSAMQQIRGNVTLIQNAQLSCVPCQEEGCERRQDSHSRCLVELNYQRVIGIIQEGLKI